MNYNIVGGIAVALLLVVWYLIRSMRRIPRYDFTGAGVQPQAGGQAVAQQPAGERRISLFSGFAFLFAAAVAFPAAYFLRGYYPWNGAAFITVATAAFFIKMRYGKKDITSWDEVWDWLTASKRVYRRGEDGKLDRSKIVGTSYRRISGFAVAEAFALGMFEVFFGYIVPNYPSVVLAFFMAILWFIATRAAENLIDKIARYFSYTLVIAVAGSAVVITLYFFFYQHVEQRMAPMLVFALAFWILSRHLRKREDAVAKHAGFAFLAASALLVTSIVADGASLIPAKQWFDQVREFQSGKRDDIKVRFLPRVKAEPAQEQSPESKKTENTPASQVRSTPAPPAQPAQTQPPQPVRVEIVVKNEARPNIPVQAQTAPFRQVKEELTFEQIKELIELDNELYER